MDRITLKKIENFFKQKFNSKKIKIEGRANKNDSAEVLIDDEFYTRRMTPEMQALRDALDKVLNHNKDMDEGSDMELTKIKLI